MSTPTAPKLPRPPRWMIYLLIVMVVASWIPLGWIAVARTSRSPKPRIHLIQDMDVQPRYGPQDWTPLFADQRAMRLPVAGTVARGELEADDHFYRGYATDPATGKAVEQQGERDNRRYFNEFPPQVKIDMTLLRRGQERFNIYCAVCHGPAGYGDGPIHNRASQLKSMALATGGTDAAALWVPPRNLHDVNIRGAQPGYLYKVISEGMGKMMPYDTQIEPMDRWAIVAYIKALQLSQTREAAALPQGMQPVDLGREHPAKMTLPAPPGAEGDLVAAGKAIFFGKGICFTCHQVPGGPPTVICPSFVDGIVGKEETVTIGVGGPEQTVVVDKAYFRESIMNPTAKIVVSDATGQAYQPIMIVPQPLTEQEIDALWAYVSSFGEHKQK